MAKSIRVLSIDGGGMRGVIPALLLSALGELSGHHTTDLFDLVVGTSTGGILALGVTVPGSDGQPAYDARDLVSFYTDDGRTIFPGGGPPTWKERIFGRGETFKDRLYNPAQRFGSVFGGNPKFAENARYFTKGLDQTLTEAFGATPLSAALVDVAITTYDANSATAAVFSRSDALANPQADLSMVDAARATSAAPTFFPPVQMVWNGTAALSSMEVSGPTIRRSLPCRSHFE